MARFGDFTLLDDLGQSASADRFRAMHDTLGGPFFVKRFVRVEGAWSGALLSRCDRLMQLRDDRVVPHLGHGEVDGVVFVVAPFIEGLSAKELVENLRERRVALPMDSLLFIIREAFLAVDAAHRAPSTPTSMAPLVHGEATSDHVHISAQGKVFLSGLATPRTLTPSHPKEVSFDVAAVGATVYDLIAATRGSAQRSSLPPSLDRLVRRALAIGTDVAAPSPREMADSVDEVADSLKLDMSGKGLVDVVNRVMKTATKRARPLGTNTAADALPVLEPLFEGANALDRQFEGANAVDRQFEGANAVDRQFEAANAVDRQFEGAKANVEVPSPFAETPRELTPPPTARPRQTSSSALASASEPTAPSPPPSVSSSTSSPSPAKTPVPSSSAGVPDRQPMAPVASPVNPAPTASSSFASGTVPPKTPAQGMPMRPSPLVDAPAMRTAPAPITALSTAPSELRGLDVASSDEGAWAPAGAPPSMLHEPTEEAFSHFSVEDKTAPETPVFTAGNDRLGLRDVVPDDPTPVTKLPAPPSAPRQPASPSSTSAAAAAIRGAPTLASSAAPRSSSAVPPPPSTSAVPPPLPSARQTAIKKETANEEILPPPNFDSVDVKPTLPPTAPPTRPPPAPAPPPSTKPNLGPSARATSPVPENDPLDDKTRDGPPVADLTLTQPSTDGSAETTLAPVPLAVRALLDRGKITTVSHQRALQEQKKRGGRLLDILIADNVVGDSDAADTLADEAVKPRISDDGLLRRIPAPELTAKLPATFALANKILPLRLDAGVLILAVADPFDRASIDEATRILQAKSVHTHVATHGAIRRAIAEAYRKGAAPDDGHRILVCTTDDEVIERLGPRLAQEGYAVELANDAALARRMLRDHAPDAVVLQSTLGDVSGIELLPEIRSTDGGQDLPVFVIGPDDDDLEARVLDLGGDDYFGGVMNVDVVVKKIRRAVQKRPPRTKLPPPEPPTDDFFLEEPVDTGPPPDTSSFGAVISDVASEPTGVMGTLRQMAVSEIVQSLELGRKTARVELVPNEGPKGAFAFDNGQIVFSTRDDGLVGEPAFYALAKAKEGFFRIHYGDPGPSVNITKPTTFLLLEAMRLMDEESRGPDADDHSS